MIEHVKNKMRKSNMYLKVSERKKIEDEGKKIYSGRFPGPSVYLYSHALRSRRAGTLPWALHLREPRGCQVPSSGFSTPPPKARTSRAGSV